ncbi:hypothetical protein ACTFIV_010042 [Dictyostelium citrinum]
METINPLSFMVYYNGEINRIYLNEYQENVNWKKTSSKDFLKILSKQPILEIPSEVKFLKLSIDSLEPKNYIDLSKLKSNSIVYIRTKKKYNNNNINNINKKNFQ